MTLQVSLSILLIVQFIVVVFHDMIDIPGWTYGRQVQALIGRRKFWVATCINAIFPGIAAGMAIYCWHRAVVPSGVRTYWVIYCAISALSAIMMWYVPYLLGCDAVRKQEYARMYAGTYHILPPRGDNPRPNVLHICIHLLFAVNLAFAIAFCFSR